MDASHERRESHGDGTGPAVVFAVPHGRYPLSAAADDALRSACSAPPRGDDGRAHPAFAFVVALGGMGMTIADICARLGLPFDTGAMLGRCRIAFDRPLLVDCYYNVAGHVAAVTRKASRRFGAADHVSLAVLLRTPSLRFATVDLTMIVPVGSAAA